jgi:hypothetical protein
MGGVHWQCRLRRCSPLSEIMFHQEDILIGPFAHLGNHFHKNTRKTKLEKKCQYLLLPKEGLFGL